MVAYARNPQTVPDDSPGGSTVRQGVADQNNIAIDDLYTNLNTHSNSENGRTHIQIDESLDYIETNFFPVIEGSVEAAEAAAEAAENAEASTAIYAQNAADCAALASQVTEGLQDQVDVIVSDLVDLTNEFNIHESATGTAVHGLGDASTKTVMENETDTTEDRILKVDSFGLGNSGVNNTSNSVLAILSTGFYRGNSMTGTPGGSTDEFLLTCNQLDGSNKGFVAQRQVDGELFSGIVDNNLLIPWRKMFDDKNVVGTVSETGGEVSGAIFQTNTNIYGTYIKYCDGNLICVHSMNSDDTDPATWTFPYPFIAQPSFVGITPVNSTTLILAGNVVAGEFAVDSVGFQVCNAAGARVFVNCQLCAIGRWYE